MMVNQIKLKKKRLYSFLVSSKASKFTSLVGSQPVSVTDHANSANVTNLVVTIPPDLSLTRSVRSILAKGLKFVPSPGPLTCFQLRLTQNPFLDACD